MQLELVGGIEEPVSGPPGRRLHPDGSAPAAGAHSLVFQQRLRRLPILRRQVIGVLRKPFTGQNVLQDDQHPQILFGLDAEEGRNPAERLRPARMGVAKRLHAAQIITWAVTSLVEGVVDNQLPPLIGVVERRVRSLILNSTIRPLGLAPQKVMGLLELQLPGNAKLLEQHLADAPDTVPLVVLTVRLFNDGLRIDAGELDGDVGFAASSPMRISPTLAPSSGSAAGLPGLHGRESAS